MDNLSPFEVYAAKLHGDDMEHLRNLFSPENLSVEIPHRPTSDCPACQRIFKAAALAEFVELEDPERRAA